MPPCRACRREEVYKRILVPMENEDHQAAALAHVGLLARDVGATVILAWLIPVVASDEYFMKRIQVEVGSSGARRQEQGERFLSQAAEALRSAGVETVAKVIVTVASPEQAILETAQEEGVDLIVMATLPQSAVGRFLLGSVGEKVRYRSPVPVLFVNPATQDQGKG
jgi:nucleotide-binding universal stress UspA family protein